MTKTVYGVTVSDGDGNSLLGLRSNDDHYSSTIQDVFLTEHEIL